MPIVKEEFDSGDLPSKVEDDIISFLKERKEKAFTSQEIMGGIDLHTNFSTSEIARMSTFIVADFTALLYELVRKGKAKMKIVNGRIYFMAGGPSGKCPKCGTEVAEPKKTWKMAGRPDRKGRRLQLQIGLFECSKHGAFRTVLDKKKIKT